MLASAALSLLVACQAPPEPDPEPAQAPSLPRELAITPAHWDAMAGWATGDPRPAITAFQRNCDVWQRRDTDAWLNPRAQWAGRISDWLPACAALDQGFADPGSARQALQDVFQPMRLTAVDPEAETVRQTGLMTGYYEPFVEVRETRQGSFTQPLRRRPDDLVTVDLGRFDESLAGRRLVGEVEDGQLVAYKDRSEIEAEDAGEVFAWGEPIHVFFLQIQGSGRLVYPDGRQERAAFAAHNGRPYRSIGRELIERGALESHAASKSGIEAWLIANGPEATAELFSVNPRYVFFRTEALSDPDLGPAGSAGIALTPMASIAVDMAHQAHGVPIWIRADLPELSNWTGLVIAQDSGGAITGPIRGDFFWGWGDTAERRAGTTRAQAQWTALLPAETAQSIIDATPPA